MNGNCWLLYLWMVESPEVDIGCVFWEELEGRWLVLGKSYIKHCILWDYVFNPRGKGELQSVLCSVPESLLHRNLRGQPLESSLDPASVEFQPASLRHTGEFEISSSPISSVFVQCKQFLP